LEYWPSTSRGAVRLESISRAMSRSAAKPRSDSSSPDRLVRIMSPRRLSAHDLEPAPDAICAVLRDGVLKTGRNLDGPTHMTAGCHAWTPRARDVLEHVWKAQDARWERFLNTMTGLETPVETWEFEWCFNLNTPADVQSAGLP
jgi:hypothetical protein